MSVMRSVIRGSANRRVAYVYVIARHGRGYKLRRFWRTSRSKDVSGTSPEPGSSQVADSPLVRFVEERHPQSLMLSVSFELRPAGKRLCPVGPFLTTLPSVLLPKRDVSFSTSIIGGIPAQDLGYVLSA